MDDILEALAGEARPQTSGKCKLARWLDDIPAERPGRTELVDSVLNSDSKVDGYRTIPQIGRVIRRLGLDISDKTVGEHRRRSCRCFD